MIASLPPHTTRHPLSWSYVQAVYEGEGWLSIGFSDHGRMRGSDAVIGLPADGTVLEYDMDDYNRPVEAMEQARGGPVSVILGGLELTLGVVEIKNRRKETNGRGRELKTEKKTARQ